MARPPHPGPTERELLLLKILWQRGPSSVKQIRDVFPYTPKPAHTSLQTNLQGMLDKGYVTRTAGEYAHQYTAAVEREEVEQNAIKDLMGRLFDGNALRLISTALVTEQASPEELRQLQALIDERVKRD